MPEAVEEKQGQPAPAPPSPPGTPSPVFERAVRGWVVFLAFCWGATVYFLAPRDSRLWEPPVTRVGDFPVRPMLFPALVVGGIIVWLCLRKFGSRLRWLKPGQGRPVRVATLVGFAGMALFGCVSFYRVPSISSPWWQDLWVKDVFGVPLHLKPMFFPSAAVFATLLFVAYLLLNRGSWTDFLVETEGELKKVSWPARKEYLGSSAVVVVVVVIVSLFLHFIDMGLSKLMQKLGIGF